MNYNTIDALIQALDEIDARVQHLESSPNRAFELIEEFSITPFHWFNLKFKNFWAEFEYNSARQILLFQDISKRHTSLCNRYIKMFQEQRDYLKELSDLKNVKDIAPFIFLESGNDVIGYYYTCLMSYRDKDKKPLYEIELGRNEEEIICDNKLYSNQLNYNHYQSFCKMYNCYDSIFHLMCVILSYPDEVINGYKPSQKDIIAALEYDLRLYAKEIGKTMERELEREIQPLKTYRNHRLDSNLWSEMMKHEDEVFDLAIKGQLGGNIDKRFDNIDEKRRKMLTDNSELLQKIKDTCLDGYLFDISHSVETRKLLLSLNADNLDLFYELVLRQNIIQREMFPDKLNLQYDEWINPKEEQPSEEIKETCLNAARQSKLDEIIGILQKGDWKQPATAENVEQLLNVVFGKDTSLLDDSDADKCKKMWALVEGGGGERMLIAPANLAGFFKEENLLKGSPKEISTALFGNGNQVNNINKGNSNRCSEAFKQVIPFLKKYIDKIIRQV